MAYKYPNFAAEMARTHTDYAGVYKCIAGQMGKSTDTVSNWINGRGGEMPVKAAFAIKDEFFPDFTIDYLFNEKPLAPVGMSD